jgi:hypothetical protein
MCLLAWGALLAGVAYGQVEQNQPGKDVGAVGKDKVADAIEKVRQGNFEKPFMESYYVERIADARAVQAVPVLKEAFARSQDVPTKAHIAGALVRLGDKEGVYWDFLVEQAIPAIDSPDPRLVDSQGNTVSGQLSPEFIAWTKAHNVSSDPVYGLPVNVILLADTGDPRGIPLLRRGLLSPNYFIQAAAARGLDNIQDKDSIPLMIEACRRGPEAAAAGIARALVYFDDPRAQSAVDTYLPLDMAKALREAKAQGIKPF